LRLIACEFAAPDAKFLAAEQGILPGRAGNFARPSREILPFTGAGPRRYGRPHGKEPSRVTKPTKLGALRLLGETLATIEQRREQRIARGEDAAVVDRDTAQLALTAVVAFCEGRGLQSRPLVRLLGELMALTAGASPSPMLTPATTRHRRPDAHMVEGLKGRLAAIMEFRQQAGMTRKDAADWVVRHAPAKLKRNLPLASRAALDSWLVKWGGARGATPGTGRDGYLAMRAILNARQPSEQQLKDVMGVLAKMLAG
jgi:hypothetical protein